MPIPYPFQPHNFTRLQPVLIFFVSVFLDFFVEKKLKENIVWKVSTAGKKSFELQIGLNQQKLIFIIQNILQKQIKILNKKNKTKKNFIIKISD